MLKKILRTAILSVIRSAVLIIIILCLFWLYLAQPLTGSGKRSDVVVNTERMKEIVETITEEYTPRNWEQTDNLDACAEYIANHFRKAKASVEFQVYEARGGTYRNVIARFDDILKGEPDSIEEQGVENNISGDKGYSGRETLIVGAHYDAFAQSPGADDNTSAVAGLIELAYLTAELILEKGAPSVDIEMVAYTMEEPPFFPTGDMGSAVHAKRFVESGRVAKGVIVLEMIGYYDDSPGSQDYPMPMLRLFYPNRGDFIAIVGRTDQGRWIRQVKRQMKGASDVPVYSLRAPEFVSGVDFSDHRSYWPYDIPAVMITDTAFYRNPYYHTIRDTAETLDYRRMGEVVKGVFEVIRHVCW